MMMMKDCKVTQTNGEGELTWMSIEIDLLVHIVDTNFFVLKL